MNTPDRLEVAYAMQKHGGSFVRALSQCIVLADPDNLERIKLAWPDYWAKYSAIAANMNEEAREG